MSVDYACAICCNPVEPSAYVCAACPVRPSQRAPEPRNRLDGRSGHPTASERW